MKIHKFDIRRKNHKLLKTLVIALIFALMAPMASFAVTPEGIDTTWNGEVKPVPVSLDVDLQISLTENREISVEIPLSSEVEDPEQIELFLVRDGSRSYCDPCLFQFPYIGGALEEWKTEKDPPDNNMFTDIVKTIEEKEKEDGSKIKILKISFKSNLFFYSSGFGWGSSPTEGKKPDYSVPHINGGYFLDKCGYFKLNAFLGGEPVGCKDAKIVPYHQYHLMPEIYKAVDYVREEGLKKGLYVEKGSIGESSGGRDMPYLIIADKEASVKEWLKYKELAEEDPEKAIEGLKSGAFNDLRVPVMYSNIHPNEVSATDGMVEFLYKIVSEDEIPCKLLERFTLEGIEELARQFGPPGVKDSLAVPDLVKDKATYLGFIKGEGLGQSGKVDLEKFYEIDNQSINVEKLLKDVFFIIVPEENVDGRTYNTRVAHNGYDLNRDNCYQTTPETTGMQHLISKYNPVSLVEFHGRVQQFQIEPCDPPHGPNFEYDKLADHLVGGGEAMGIAAVANNPSYNSYVMPQRDYLSYTGEKEAGSNTKYATYWYDPWDDVSSGYTPQFAMLQGTVSYTVELPAYSDDTTDLVVYGILGQSEYIAKEKIGYLKSQAEIYRRGVKNYNSNKEIGPWYCDQNDIEGAELEIFRPVFDGPEENKNYYPECYIIPMDRDNQKNLKAAGEIMEQLTRNGAKVNLTKSEFTYKGVKYPAGTIIVPMYQAKRSVANEYLCKGIVLHNWTILYSESITQFDQTRGFDCVTVAEPKEYDRIRAVMGDTVGYEEAKKYVKGLVSSFDGVKDADVIIDNTSLDAAAAVNALLADGKTVGLITDGPEEGDFICSYADFETIRYKYVLTATGVYAKDENIKALIIAETPKVYVAEKPGTATTGYDNTPRLTAYDYNYDKLALAIMNFATVDKAADANAIVCGGSLNKEDTINAVKEGTPFITYGISSAKNALKIIEGGFKREAQRGGMDCLGYVTYPEKTLVNASYINEGDDILYGYGIGYFTEYPEGSKVLMRMDGTKDIIQGFIPRISEKDEKAYNEFINGSVQAIEYKDDKVDMALFANTLTNKGHQRDEYTFISNFIFSRMLGDTAYTGTAGPAQPVTPPVEPVPPVHPEAPPTGDPANMLIWVYMAMLSIGGCLVVYRVCRKNNR